MIYGKKLCGEELEKALAAMPQTDIESLIEDLDALDIMEPDEDDEDDKCPTCEGTGTSWDGIVECLDCGGTGR